MVAAIALGGALGGTARYGVTRLLPSGSAELPWATLTANISGSFLLGLALALLIERRPPNRRLPAFIATGVLGSYTTFSAFSVETSLLLEAGKFLTAAAYVATSVILGLSAALTGVRLGRRAALGSDH
ncbi:MAG: fluoride efflux transporter CrcB [Actinomycetota bacterium]